MKKIFTLMLTFACAMFVGVSCTPGDGDGGNTQTDPFVVKWDKELTTAMSAACRITPLDKETPFVVFTEDEIVQYGFAEQYSVVTEQLQAMVDFYIQNNVIMSETLGAYWFKGNPSKEWPTKEFSRYDAEQTVKFYVAHLSSVEKVDWGEGMYGVSAATVAPEYYEFTVPFKTYPTVTIPEDQLSHELTAAAGTLEISCTVENALDGVTVAVDENSLPHWVTSTTWADGKLTVEYAANTTPVARYATLFVTYGDYWFTEVNLTQAKDAAAQDVTFTFNVDSSYFWGSYLDVTPSDTNVKYVLLKQKHNETTNWEEKANDCIGMEYDYYTGALTDSVFEHYSNSWNEWDLYAFAVETELEERENWDGSVTTREKVKSVLSSVSHVKVSNGTEAKPTIAWDDDKLVWNEEKGRYDLYVQEKSTVTLKYKVENPCVIGKVGVNSTYDSYNVIKDDEFTFDTEDSTVSFTMEAYDNSQDQMYQYFTLTLKYTSEAGTAWGAMTKNVRVYISNPNVSAEPLAN